MSSTGLSCLVLPVCLGSLMWFLFSTSSAGLTITRWPHLLIRWLFLSGGYQVQRTSTGLVPPCSMWPLLLYWSRLNFTGWFQIRFRANPVHKHFYKLLLASYLLMSHWQEKAKPKANNGGNTQGCWDREVWFTRSLDCNNLTQFY